MCKTCPYNVFNYGWDPNGVRLIKARALLDYQHAVANAKQKRKEYWKGELTSSAIMLGFILLVCIALYVVFEVLLAAAPAPPSAQPATLSIEQTIRQVDTHLRDVNFDDKINCIDYAVVFYELYPNSKIIRCWDNGAAELIVFGVWVFPRIMFEVLPDAPATLPA
jgi:hypothetical protein